MNTTLTSKGQMTLPKAIRERLGLKTGDELDVTIEDGRIVMIPRNLHLADLASLLPKPARVVSIDEMNAAITQAAADARR